MPKTGRGAPAGGRPPAKRAGPVRNAAKRGGGVHAVTDADAEADDDEQEAAEDEPEEQDAEEAADWIRAVRPKTLNIKIASVEYPERQGEGAIRGVR